MALWTCDIESCDMQHILVVQAAGVHHCNRTLTLQHQQNFSSAKMSAVNLWIRSSCSSWQGGLACYGLEPAVFALSCNAQNAELQGFYEV